MGPQAGAGELNSEFFENAEPPAYRIVLEVEATFDPNARDAGQPMIAVATIKRAVASL